MEQHPVHTISHCLHLALGSVHLALAVHYTIFTQYTFRGIPGFFNSQTFVFDNSCRALGWIQIAFKSF